MKNYWLDRIHERELVVAARWHPPTGDEDGWYPIRPMNVCAESLPGAQPLHISQDEPEPYTTKKWKRLEWMSSRCDWCFSGDFSAEAGKWTEPNEFFLNQQVPDEVTFNFDVNSEYAPDFDGYAFEK